VRAIFDKIENRKERYELNLYIAGEDEQPTPAGAGTGAREVAAQGGATSSSEASPEVGASR
jgi:hypothetical protein